jgi:hypothetical protein
MDWGAGQGNCRQGDLSRSDGMTQEALVDGVSTHVKRVG